MEQEACSAHVDLPGNSIFDYKSCELFHPGTLDFRGDMQSTSLALQLDFSELYMAVAHFFALPCETGHCLN